MPQEFIGANSHQSIKEIIEENNFQKIFLVTNKKSFLAGGVSDYVYRGLIGCQYHRFNNFNVNPKFEDLQKGIEEYHAFKPDLIIGVGGGSAMDMAKLIHYMSENHSIIKDDFLNQIKSKPQKKLQSKLMLIPTTSGSGSEATQFAVIYIDNKKYSLDTHYLFPDYAIVDGVFTEKLPKNVTAYTGADALCQAIESFWSNSSTEESKGYSLKAIDLILKNLSNAVHRPSLEIRNEMALGSYYAGKAINITRTTAPHAFSYYLTTHYGYPHGQAVSIMLPYFVEENAKVKDLQDLYPVFDVQDAKGLKDKLINLFQDIDLFNELKNILKDDLEAFIDAVDLERLKNNPAQLTKKEYLKIFTQKLKE